jgi:hypothetical protein
MNIIHKQNGFFVLQQQDSDHVLGDSIDITLRRVVYQKFERDITNLQYVVELKLTSDFEQNQLATLQVPLNTDDSKIAMSMFRGEAFGDTHRLGLVPYSDGYVMSINGLLYDGDRILHVRDICQ